MLDYYISSPLIVAALAGIALLFMIWGYKSTIRKVVRKTERTILKFAFGIGSWQYVVDGIKATWKIIKPLFT